MRAGVTDLWWASSISLVMIFILKINVHTLQNCVCLDGSDDIYDDASLSCDRVLRRLDRYIAWSMKILRVSSSLTQVVRAALVNMEAQLSLL